jgi:hypothetical protein
MLLTEITRAVDEKLMAAARTSTVFVRNLAYGATDEEVRAFHG